MGGNPFKRLSDICEHKPDISEGFYMGPSHFYANFGSKMVVFGQKIAILAKNGEFWPFLGQKGGQKIGFFGKIIKIG